MNQQAAGEHFINCLLAQLRLNQQRYIETKEGQQHRRFKTVMDCLARMRLEGRAKSFPVLVPSTRLAEYEELDVVVLHWMVRGWTVIDCAAGLIELTLSEREAHELMSCLMQDERDDIQWLASIFVDPSMAGQPIR